jgi:hypothetical protein
MKTPCNCKSTLTPKEEFYRRIRFFVHHIDFIEILYTGLLFGLGFFVCWLIQHF